jgi:sialic acid synthase SpsE
MLFIAEIGLNHNGNFDLAFELIKKAKLAGADVAKFQLGWKDGEGEINQIDLDVLKKLGEYCNYFEIELMVSIFHHDAYLMAIKYGFNRYKIASRTLIDDPVLVDKIVSEGKETFISLGMWDKANMPYEGYDNVKYLWCKSKYPCEPWDLIGMPKDFRAGPYSGYSDHTIGIDIPLMAIARGASIIEKHFTLNKSDTTIRDHVLSATPDEFLTMTTIGKSFSKNLGIGI